MSKRRNLLDSAEKRRSLQNVAMARGRLKGALQDIVTHSDEESDSDDAVGRRRNVPNRRPKTGSYSAPLDSIPVPHQSYIMKLFDRSVDLARFDETSPLYPICRAWMQNTPRVNPHRTLRNSSPVKREHNPEMADQYINREIRDIRALPKPDVGVTERCPSPLQIQKESSKERIDLNAAPVAKDVLMAEHKQRWGQIRSKWHQQSALVGQRYQASFELLDAMKKS